MQADVVVIEDVRELADLIAMFLAKEGLAVRCFESAEEALDRLQAKEPDLIVLDINLPGMDGFEFLGRARRLTSCPVIIVSARQGDDDVVTGLGHGADDFVTKPFSPRVLVAKVRALLRRSRGASTADEGGRALRFGPFSLDREAFVLTKNGERVPLSVKEYGVLEFLLANAGKPQPPQAIFDAVWKSAYGDLTAVGVYVQRLRKKLEDDPADLRYIQTEFGRGYCFNLPGPDDRGGGA